MESKTSSPVQVTLLLRAAEAGDAQAAKDVLPLVYEQLRALARARMSHESSDHTLQATALVHEAYARLVGNVQMRWVGRAHFFHASAEAMRRILIEHARRKQGPRRGGGRKRVPLGVVDLAAQSDPEEILALDEAISRLEVEAPAVAAVVRLRFYAGLSVQETAESLGISPRSVNRDWTFARAWLIRQLGDGRA